MAVSEQDLLDRQERAQARVEKEKHQHEPRPTSGSEVTEEARTIVCAQCRKSFDLPVLEIEGKRLTGVMPDLCPPCGEEKAAAEEMAAVEQSFLFRRQAVEADLPRILANIGVNVREHGRCTLENNFDTKTDARALAAIRRFNQETSEAGEMDPVQGVYLSGGTGVGKTALAVAAVRDLLLSGGVEPDEVVFDHAGWLIHEIQETYNGGRTLPVLRARLDAKVWVLDDLGAERPSDDVSRLLTELFTSRALHPNLVTSNYPAHELEVRYPEFQRVGSRLGPQYFEHVQIEGGDRRFNRPGKRV